MQVFSFLQMFYLLQRLLIAALTNSVEAKQPSTTAFFFLMRVIKINPGKNLNIWIPLGFPAL